MPHQAKALKAQALKTALNTLWAAGYVALQEQQPGTRHGHRGILGVVETTAEEGLERHRMRTTFVSNGAHASTAPQPAQAVQSSHKVWPAR